LEATRAAGSILLRDEERTGPLVAAAVPVHGALSIGWGIAMSVALPRSHTVAWGVAAGLAIAALDLGVVGRAFPEIRELPQAPQVADHICFGVVVAEVVRRRREARAVT
jgi:hypothetical protein